MDEEKMTMADFEEEINASFVKFRPGEAIKGTVVSIDEDEVSLDLNSVSRGIIPKEEWSNDPDFQAMDEIRMGDVLTVIVLYEDEDGQTVTSLRQAKEVAAWETLTDAMENHTIYEVKIKEVVPSGVVAYLEGIRGFIPASKLAAEYVEDLDSYVGKKVKVQVITADEEENRLVLSAKEVAKERLAKEQEAKLNALQKGFITEGTITRIESYGCFVEFGEGLTGLVHISQICNRFLKSPKEVVKLGMQVKVKVLSVEDGKIRLSMKEAEDIAPEVESDEEIHLEYKDEEATTSLAGLLKGIRLED
ncbi:MAG: S1 RNA-binding domain-containing protein [Clostridiales bacterium]|nr:S1 RNA-binding domain-containing protein [Eubacterium sp.]MDD7349866.1 S1 RNA-binding domain-containing protein [Clostridiales bacterium]